MQHEAGRAAVPGYYKVELIRGPAHKQPWMTVEDVELATLEWGVLAQHPAPARLPRRPYAGRVRAKHFTLPNGTTPSGSKSHDPGPHQTQGGSQGGTPP